MPRVIAAEAPPAPAIDAAAVLRVDVVGGLSLRVGGAELVLGSRKGRALLAYLAMLGGAEASRERLAGLLWSESAETQARASLRQVLFDLREALARHGCDALVAGRTGVALARDAVRVDIVALRRGVEAGEVADRLLSQARLCESLLLGFEDVDPGFRDWLEEFRTAQHERLRAALARGYAAPGTARPLRRRLAEAALRLDPTDEEACRCAMRLAAEDGAIGAALRAYEALYDVLGDELDMEPSAATQALVAEIKQGLVAPAAAVGAATRRATVAAAPRAGGVPRVAVLPFRAIGADPVPGYFAEGLVEDIICGLAGLREPVVLSGNSTQAYRGRIEPGRVGRELDARYLVTGTARQLEGRLKLTVELVEAASGAVIWAQGYDATDARLFEAQDRIAAAVANTLAPQVGAAELRAVRERAPSDLGAYHLVLRARERMFAFERTASDEANALLREAIGRDPTYAAAHVAAASWHGYRVGQRWTTNRAAEQSGSVAHARRAAELDPGNPRAWSLFGHYRGTLDRDLDGALPMFDRALESAPNDIQALINGVPTLAFIGLHDEARRRAERAIALSPHDPFAFRAFHFLSIAHFAAEDWDAAAEWGLRAMSANPRYMSNARATAAALVALGRIGEARVIAQDVMASEPEFRVRNLIAVHPFRDLAKREGYGRKLVLAGFPE